MGSRTEASPAPDGPFFSQTKPDSAENEQGSPTGSQTPPKTLPQRRD